MESGRIVRFLIVMFALLAAVFFSLYRMAKDDITVLDIEFAQQAVVNLQSKGVKINADVIDRKIPSENIYVLYEDGENEYSHMLEQAFKNCLGTGIYTTKLNTPQGLSIAFYSDNGEDKELGKLRFSESQADFVYNAYGSNVSRKISVLHNDETEIAPNELSFIEKLVEGLNHGNEMGYVVTGSVTDADYRIISIMQTLGGFVIKEMSINFVFENQDPVHVEGSWITARPEAGYNEKLTDGINVLYKLDTDNISSILDERLAYSLKKGNEGKSYLLPCWEITLERKNGGVVKEYVDAV